jgi:tRNA(fMet)-specific endonuclease VapC
MNRYILDTNHLTAYQFLQSNVMAKIAAIGMPQIALTGITIEEQAQGWLKAIKAASQAPLPRRAEKFSWAYGGLRMSVQMMNQFEILDFPSPPTGVFWSSAAKGFGFQPMIYRLHRLRLK